MEMYARLMAASALLFAGATAQAAESVHKGVYFGGSYGSSVFDDDGAFVGFNFDDTDNAYQAHAGYKFLRYFAVEGRYTNYGTFTLESVEFDVTALSVHAVGIIPFGTSGWELFGQAGFGRLEADILGIDEEQSTFAGGIGVRYYPTQSLSIGVQTDVHVWEDDSLGTSLVPGVGATQISMQLMF